MNLREAILKEHSKNQCNNIVNWVGNNQERFDELFNLILKNEEIVAQRGSWPMSYCVEAHHSLINKHWERLLKHIRKQGLHDAIKRNVTRLMQFTDIPKKWHGDAMDICFQFLEDPGESVAVKVCSLTVLGNLSVYYPEIIPEIRMIIEHAMPHQTPAFKSKAKHLLATWNKPDKLAR